MNTYNTTINGQSVQMNFKDVPSLIQQLREAYEAWERTPYITAPNYGNPAYPFQVIHRPSTTSVALFRDQQAAEGFVALMNGTD